MCLLSGDNISVADIEQAVKCLHEFVKHFPHLYFLRYMTMDVHQLVHLIQNRGAGTPMSTPQDVPRERPPFLTKN